MVLGEPEGSISTDAAAFTGCWCHHIGFSVPLDWGWMLLFFFPQCRPISHEMGNRRNDVFFLLSRSHYPWYVRTAILQAICMFETMVQLEEIVTELPGQDMRWGI